MITLESCPNCGSVSITKFNRDGNFPWVLHEIMPGVKLKARIITRYAVCLSCNLIFQNPRMSDKDIFAFYNKGFYRQSLNLKEDDYDAFDYLRAQNNARIASVQCGEISSHLDVGCGKGYFLDAVGAQLKVAVEPDLAYIRIKSAKVYPQLDKVPSSFKFDLVSAIHVLEHDPHPLNYLKKMTGFLKKDGYLMVEVPTWKSEGDKLSLQHLFHFEPDVLRLMCMQAGLEVIHTEFTSHLVLICKPVN